MNAFPPIGDYADHNARREARIIVAGGAAAKDAAAVLADEVGMHGLRPSLVPFDSALHKQLEPQLPGLGRAILFLVIGRGDRQQRKRPSVLAETGRGPWWWCCVRGVSRLRSLRHLTCLPVVSAWLCFPPWPSALEQRPGATDCWDRLLGLFVVRVRRCAWCSPCGGRGHRLSRLWRPGQCAQDHCRGDVRARRSGRGSSTCRSCASRVVSGEPLPTHRRRGR